MIDLAQMLDTAAFDLFKARQPLAAAIVFAEALRLAPENADAWCKLGSAVGDSAGVLVTTPFWTWSARCLRTSLGLNEDGAYADLARERLALLGQTIDTGAVEPARADEIDELLGFLDINERIVADALVALADPMMAVMALGDHGGARFAPAIIAAIRGELGAGAQRSALKRIGPFADNVGVRAAVRDLAASPAAEEAQPYLGWAMSHLGLG